MVDELEPQLGAYAQLAVLYGDLAELRGVSRDALFDGTGVNPVSLKAPSAAISISTLKAVARRGMALLDRADNGVALGLMVSARTFGFLGYAALSSATLGEALAVALKFQQGFSTFQLTMVDESEERVAIEFEDRVGWEELSQQALESTLVCIHSLLHELGGLECAADGVEVYLACRKPAGSYPLEAHIPARIHFESEVSRYCFARKLLELPIATMDETLRELAVHQCEQVMNSLPEGASLLRQVGQAIEAELPNGALRDRVARRVGYGSRTLQRRLLGLGTSYAGLVDTTRRAQAGRFMVTTSISLEDVAERLGYGDVASFRRAFRRWFGCTPGMYRKANKGRVL